MTWGNIYINANQGISLRTRRSKKLLRALRHAPKDYKIELDDQGFVTVASLAAGAQVPKSDIQEIASLDTKRFKMSPDKAMISATYGHTAKKIPMTQAKPMGPIYATIRIVDYDKVKMMGLKPEKGFYIPLFNRDQSHRRWNPRDRMFAIDLVKAERRRVIFYMVKLSNGAIKWYTTFIPPDCIPHLN